MTSKRAELPPFAGVGPIARYDHREDEDYYSQAGALYRLMSKDQQDLLIRNLVGAMKSVPEFIQLRQIEHFLKADREYGEAIRRGLGLEKKGG